MGTTFDPNAVMLSVVANANKQASDKYADDLKAYQNYVVGWINANTHGRDIALASNTAFVPTAPPTIPTKTVYSLDADGKTIDKTSWQDPSIKDPVLPPVVVPTAPSTAFVTGAPANTDAIQSKLDTILLICGQIYSAVSKG